MMMSMRIHNRILLVLLVLGVIPEMLFSQNETQDSSFLYHFSGEPLSFDSLGASRCLFMVNSPPQCHACEESLYAFLNTLSDRHCPIFIVWCDISDNLTRREKCRRSSSSVPEVTEVLFANSDELAERGWLNQHSIFPLLVLVDNHQKTATVLSGEALFVDDVRSSIVRKEADKQVRRFIR